MSLRLFTFFVGTLVVVALSAAACGGGDDDDSPDGTAQPTDQPAQTGQPDTDEPADTSDDDEGEPTEQPEANGGGGLTLAIIIDGLAFPPDAPITVEGSYAAGEIPYSDPTGEVDTAAIVDAEYRVYAWPGDTTGALLWFPNNIAGGLDEIYAGANEGGPGQLAVWTLRDSSNQVLIVGAEEQTPATATVTVILGTLE
jgi:hypothetical protein